VSMPRGRWFFLTQLADSMFDGGRPPTCEKYASGVVGPVKPADIFNDHAWSSKRLMFLIRDATGG